MIMRHLFMTFTIRCEDDVAGTQYDNLILEITACLY